MVAERRLPQTAREEASPSARAAMPTPEEQLAELQTVVTALRGQVLDLSGRLDRSAHDFQQLRDNIASGNQVAGGLSGTARHLRLLDPKAGQPDTFHGDRNKVRDWIEHVMAYANSMAPGFRKALRWAMAQEEVIDFESLNSLAWEPALQADAALYDIRITITKGEPLIMVKNAPGDEAGFEAWRVITRYYDQINKCNANDHLNQITTVLR